MHEMLKNPFRGQTEGTAFGAVYPSVDMGAVEHLLYSCPRHRETELIASPALAASAAVAEVWVKDERSRMGLGSFKALGAAYCIARDAEAAQNAGQPLEQALAGRVYATASAGNHGLSLAAGARVFGAKAVIFLAETVPEAFADRLRAIGAEVQRAGATYEDSMQAALQCAEAEGWTLVSDSSWPGYVERPYQVMEGYTQMVSEIARQMPEPPSHVLLQAGVGGLAAAVAAALRRVWGDGPEIIVVEPEFAPALLESIRAGHLSTTQGPVSAMGRLDCKTPSMIALAGLARDADWFVTLTEQEAQQGADRLAELGLDTTVSGGAGLAALLAGLPNLPTTARVLTILSEGPEKG